MHSDFHRILRAASLAVWAVLVGPVLASIPQGPAHLSPERVQLWIALWAAFGVAFFVTTSPRVVGRLRAFPLALQTIAALGMSWVHPDYYIGFLLVIIAWQAAVYFPLRVAAGWVLAQAVLLFFLLSPAWADGCGWATSAVYLSFQAFAVVTAILLRKAWAQELEQARVQAGLAAAGEVLVERSRAHERLRISQDLHDAIGHRLTVLSLDLEVASHAPDARTRAKHVARALGASKRIMAEVREVVGALRRIDPPDLQATLEELAAHSGDLQVHVSSDPHLRLDDAERAHAVVSCAQEVITNALKHSAARNLWIQVGLEEHQVVVRARDDGRGWTEAAAGKGFGLSGMRSRLAHLGGDVEISAPAGQGFALRAWLPVAGRGL